MKILNETEAIDNDKDEEQHGKEFHKIRDYLGELQIKKLCLSWYRLVPRFYAYSRFLISKA
ncbi:MAG: hypothetical protein K2H91_11265 [Lachnospiraceae bacterium]|nr:hypothetical protein [Lachnospiraceae bacterium]